MVFSRLLIFVAFFQLLDISKRIDAQVDHINKNLSTYDFNEFIDVNLYKELGEEYSIEGSSIRNLAMINVSVYQGKYASKTSVSFAGELSDLTSNYYEYKGCLIFVQKELSSYRLPKWHDEFDSTKLDLQFNRFYFKDRRMIRWVDAEGKEFTSRDVDFLSLESTLIHDYALYRKFKK